MLVIILKGGKEKTIDLNNIKKEDTEKLYQLLTKKRHLETNKKKHSI
ncbi:hypothetical protein NBRC110019_20040 [Neptunitalea chrysea]|uniref:Uncharacterized protein n=1 Tax=Neptunitalea chrysea TaxID=1647581 RepID=A0A9W6B7Z4_9FLAO|nr:hypothetical protein NBRC110019_20040 [Neptunitalea chrysea]